MKKTRFGIYFLALFIYSFGESNFLITLYAQDWTTEYDSLRNISQEFFDTYEYLESINPAKKAYKLAESVDDIDRVFDAASSLVEAHFYASSYEEAAKVLLQIKEKYFDDLSNLQRSKLEEEFGALYLGTGLPENALLSFKVGVDYAFLANDSSRIGEALGGLSVGQFHNHLFRESIHSAKKSMEYKPKDKIHLSWMEQTLYSNYTTLDEIEVAFHHLENSHRLALEADDKLMQLLSFDLLSNYYRDTYDTSLALKFSHKALDLANELNSEALIIWVYEELASIYKELQEYDKALIYSNSIYKYYLSIGNEHRANDLLIGKAFAHLNLGDYPTAQKLGMEMLDYSISISDSFKISETETLLGVLALRKNQPKVAYSHFRKAELFTNSLSSYLMKGSVYSHLLNLPDSVLSIPKKIVLGKKLLDFSGTEYFRYYKNALISLSLNYYKLSSDSAFYYADQAFELLKRRRFSSSVLELRAKSFTEYVPFYHEVGSWYALGEGDYDTAFTLFEKAKSRALLDELAERNQEIFAGLDSGLINQLTRFQKSIDSLYMTEREFYSEQLTLELVNKQLEYDAILEQVKKTNPNWASVAYPDLFGLQEAQSMLDRETAILQYGFSEEQLFTFLIGKKEVRFIASFPTYAIKDSVRKDINSFRNAIVDQLEIDSLSKFSQPLYELLILPVAEELTRYSKVVIVPDGPLGLLPFDALIHDDRYLAQDVVLKYLPSLSVYNQIHTPNYTSDKNLLAVAVAGFDSGQQTALTRSSIGFRALPFALMEVDTIASFFENPTLLKDERIIETSLKSMDLNQYEYIHFATHGDINELLPDQSGLVLSSKINVDTVFGEDGFINAREIKNLSVSADMVVLSACNTATGKVLDGEGLLGLQRAFLVAGASSAVSSLWSIYDKSTSEFMARFYRNLSATETEEIGWWEKVRIWSNQYEPKLIDLKTLALHQTKLEMMNHPYYSHPVHWASFVITGK